MKSPLLKPAAALLVAAILSFAAFFDAGIAKAQTGAMVHNATNCAVYLNLHDASTGGVISYLIPPGGPTRISWPPSFNPTGALDAFGAVRPFVMPGGPPPGCTGCIPLGNLCCGNICYDAAAGIIIINVCPNGC